VQDALFGEKSFVELGHDAFPASPVLVAGTLVGLGKFCQGIAEGPAGTIFLLDCHIHDISLLLVPLSTRFAFEEGLEAPNAVSPGRSNAERLGFLGLVPLLVAVVIDALYGDGMFIEIATGITRAPKRWPLDGRNFNVLGVGNYWFAGAALGQFNVSYGD
jgi:hypothetical protein